METAGPRTAEPDAAAVPKTRTGFIDIQVEPESDIIVDGVFRISGNRYGPVEIEPGMHRVTCRQKDFREYSETIRVTEGELSRRRIYLEMSGGQLGFAIETGIRVFVDGKFIWNNAALFDGETDDRQTPRRSQKSGVHGLVNQNLHTPDETVSLRVSLSPL